MNNPYLDIPVFNDFAKVLDPSIYHELPDDWWVGTSDIAGSTKAVAAGRFKDVNMVGASVICAVSNALGHSDYPFIFGGDGAGFACPPDHINAVRDALAATATWANEALGFDLRVALIRIAENRAQCKGGTLRGFTAGFLCDVFRARHEMGRRPDETGGQSRCPGPRRNPAEP